MKDKQGTPRSRCIVPDCKCEEYAYDGKTNQCEDPQCQHKVTKHSITKPILLTTALLGRHVIIHGQCWGQQYAGYSYTGVIRSIASHCINGSRSPNYIIFHIDFGDDCTEVFDIEDLLGYHCITQWEFTLLRPTCLPT